MAGNQLACPRCSATIRIPGAAADLAVPMASEAVAPQPDASAQPVRTTSFWNRRRTFGFTGSILLIGVASAWLFAAGKNNGTNPASSKPALLGFSKKAELADVKVFPPEVNLTCSQNRQSVVVQALYADGATRDVTADASFSLAKPGLVKMTQQTLSPLADGTTELQVKFQGRALRVPVVVQNAKVERPISFKMDVMPVFMKAGCNSGACHGSSRGKDGFRLSLFGFDPDGDYFRLTQESIGRRINLALPEESLIIQKALGQVPHTGGERFKPDSELCKTLLRWLEAGAPKDGSNVAKVVSLELMPRQAVLEGQDASQKLTVRAKYSDGSDRDVTKLAVFISNNEVSAKVSEDGLVTAGQRGEAFIMVRFDAFNVGAQIIVIPKDLPYTFPADIAEYNYIDKLVHAKLKKLRLTPSGLCDDATFIRRASLDITGTLPTPERVRKFIEEPSAGKRDQLVDELVERKEFADIWVMKWAELLEIRSRQDQFSPKAALQYYKWLQDKFARNVPLDKIVRELITASGSTFKNPAANFYQVQTDTLKTAENTAQVFMGMRIQCAQCHNHPFDRWTMNDYYSFAAFFPRIARKQGEDPREQIIFDKPDGEVKHPVGGRTMAPKFLGGESPDVQGQSRREVLANWLASPENPYFAKNLANIVWAHFLGRGIIDPVDDVRISNPPSNQELLDALGAKFTEYQYDFKKLVRDICTSRAYQLSTRPNETNATDDRNFSHAAIRRLRAEVLLDCISQVTETKDHFQGLAPGARVVEIADGAVNNYFLTTFGRATRETVCSCEVKTEPNLSQALHLLNGNTVSDKIQNGGLVKKLLKQNKTPDEVISTLYLRCLSRPPTAGELVKLKKFFTDPKEQEQSLNDLFWSLLNSKEFIFNH